MRWRSGLRRQWRSLLLLAVAAGLGSGVALTALAGADRADSAMPRFVSYSGTATGAVMFGDPSFGSSGSPSLPPAETKAVLGLPQVQQSFRMVYVFTAVGSNGPGTVNVFGSPDASTMRAAVRPRVLAGRLPDPDQALEVSVNQFAAEKLHLRVGSAIHFRAYSLNQLDSVIGSQSANPEAPDGPAFTVHVAAIIRLPTDVNAIVPLAAKQDVLYEGQENLYLGPGFMRLLADGLHVGEGHLPGMNYYNVRLRDGSAGWTAFTAAAGAATAHAPVPVQFQAGDSSGIVAAGQSAQRGIRFEAAALALFGGLVAVVTILLVGQALVRMVQSESEDHATLRSLGATRRQLVLIAAGRGAVIGVIAAAVGIVVATLASPLMPIGLARQAEIHPGYQVNLAIVPLGALILAMVLAARPAVAEWRMSRHLAASAQTRATPRRGGVLSRMLEGTPVPLPALIGVSFGIKSGRGRLSVPVGAAIAGAVVAVAGLTTALTFGASLNHLVASPDQQGWNWDLLVGNPNSQSDGEKRGATILGADRLVDSYSAIADLGTADVSGTTVSHLLAFDPLHGSVQPRILEGRPPRGADEIVLGTETLKRIHRKIGDEVQVGVSDSTSIRLRVVGRMLAPSVGDLWANSLGDGGWVSGRLVHQQWRSPSNPTGTPPPGTDGFTLFAVRLAPGASPSAGVASLRSAFGKDILQQLPAEDAVNLQSVSDLPLALAALIAFLGVATVGNTLVVSVRRRRRDLAVLKTIGFERGQVAATVAWQATSFAFVALAVGIPLGVAAGRWAWNFVASGIDSVSTPVVPITAIVLVVPAALLICNAVSAWPARTAGRLSPAVVMRDE
jgi:cell division protein FtsX